MTHRLGLRAWATGALVLAAASACGGTTENADPSVPPSATVTSPSVATTSASPTSPSEAAGAYAATLMHRYYAVLDSVRQRKKEPISRLASVMTSTELTTERRLVMRERQQGDRQVGSTRIAALTVQAVNLDNSDPSAGKVPTVTIDVCWDVSKVDVRGPTGHSIVLPSRPDRAWTRFIVANYHWSTDRSGGWRVADGSDLKKPPCVS